MMVYLKKALWIIVLVFIGSCSTTTNELPDYAIISGKAVDINRNKMILSGDDYNFFRKTIKLDSEGNFSDTIRGIVWDQRCKLFFSSGENRSQLNILVKKGEHIKLFADLNRKDSAIVFSGGSSNINNYLTAKNELGNTFKYAGDNIYGFDEAAFKAKNKDLYTQQLRHLNNAINLTESFKSQETNDLKYEHADRTSLYEFYHGRIIEDRNFRVSDNFYDDYNKLDFDNEEQYNKSLAYKDMLYNRLRNEKARFKDEFKEKGDTNMLIIVWLYTINNITKNINIKEDILYSATREICEEQTTKDEIEPNCEYYLKVATNQSNINIVDSLYHETQKLWAGNPSPKFIDYENFNGTKSSLDDFKGKVIYIDVWATWCGPCKAQIPYLKELEKEYHGENIVFLSISIDDQDDADKWKKMIGDKNLTGVQLLADNEFDSEFISSYKINSIPRFILLDTEGNIVDPDAPRPSSGNRIRDMINKLAI